MPVNLRPFQQALERDIYQAWSDGAVNVMPVAATGSGKTVVLAKLLYDEPGASVAVAHRRELVSQIATALARNGVRHRLVGAKKGSALLRVITTLQIAEFGHHFVDPNAKTGVGGVDTIIKMDPQDAFFKQVRLQVHDEAHHVLKANKWGKVMCMFTNARGLMPTATPRRADGAGLGRDSHGLVDAMVFAPTMRQIIDMGYLTDYRVFAPPNAHLDELMQNVNISSTTGDFNADQMRKAVHDAQLTGDVVKHYLKLAPGKLGITFAASVEDAVEYAAAFRAAGVPAEVVSANTPDDLRAAILRRFKNREVLQLVNVDLFGEGFDLPAIEVVSFARPTESFALYSQQFGRALRLMLTDTELRGWNDLSDEQRRARIAASGKPVAMIIDHVGNVLRHGLPDAPQEWTLLPRERRGSSEKSDAIPTRVCVNTNVGGTGALCAMTYERFHKACPFCGFYPEPPARTGPEFVDGDLPELDAATLAVMRGEIARVDGDCVVPYGASAEIQGAVRKKHWQRQQSQAALRNAIAWWAGLEHAQGRGQSESYRRFYFKFGVDVASAQTLGAREATELAERVNAECAKFGIDASVNAAAYFSHQ